MKPDKNSVIFTDSYTFSYSSGETLTRTYNDNEFKAVVTEAKEDNYGASAKCKIVKKGTYKLKVKVTAATTAEYMAANKTVTVTIKIK